MPHPRRSTDTRPISPINPADDARARSSSEATPKTRTPLTNDPTYRRPSKPSLSSSISAGMGLNERDYALGASASGVHLGVRSGSRAEQYPARDAASSPVPSTSGAVPRPSPQKPQRTMDNKLISRELERLGLGMSNYHGSSSSSTITAVASASNLSLPTSTSGLLDSRSTPVLAASSSQLSFPSLSQHESPLGALHIHVLPLFNGEPLRAPIEDLNILVRDHLRAVLGRSPSKAMATLASDVTELVATGMLNLDAKFNGIDDEKFLTRLVEVWNFFWVQVLPYVEGVFLPLQTDPLLLSLGKARKDHRKDASSDSFGDNSHPEVRLDVRKLVLLSFRDAIILPRVNKLQELLSISNATKGDDAGVSVNGTDDYQRPRLQQMLLVLHSTSGPMTNESPTAGEYATQHLLRIIRRPSGPSSSSAVHPPHLQFDKYPLAPDIHPSSAGGRGINDLGGPSVGGGRSHPLRGGMASLAAGAPRDRRGRMIKLDTPGVEAWKRQAAFQDSDEEEDNDAMSAQGRVVDDGTTLNGEESTSGEDYGDDDLSDPGFQVGQGSTTPTMIAGHRPRAQPSPNPATRWQRRHQSDEDEEEDYGRPIQRSATASPMSLGNRI